MTKPAALCAFLLALACPISAFAQAVPKEDDAALREVVRKYVDAREARDASAVEALLTPDADQLVSDGTWRHGRAALVQGMLESSRKNPAKRTIDVETVRLATSDVALVDGRYTQTGSAANVRAMWTAFVMKRTPDGWKIAAIRNMLPAPPAK